MAVAFSEGLQLHMSHASASGYLNINHGDGWTYHAFAITDPRVPDKYKYNYPTALAAAVAYARLIGQAPMPEWSDGIKLHKSNRSNSGYRGVSYTPYASNGAHRTKRWRAIIKIDGKNQAVGWYLTAVQAAVAWARALAGGWPRHPYFQST